MKAGYITLRGSPISDLHPCPWRARYLCRNLDLQLVSSLEYLASVCESHAGLPTAALRSTISDARIELDSTTDGRLPGSMVASYALLENAIKAERLDRIGERLKRFEARRLSGFPTRVIALGDPNLAPVDREDLTDVFKMEMRVSGQNTSIFEQKDRILVQRSTDAVHQTLSVIETIAPELYAEIQRIISDILIIDSSKTNAASSFNTFGVIFLKTLKPFQTWTTYIEHIVHEAAHHLLFAIFNEHKIFARGTETRFTSPLRSDPRPLDAVFHAMFVLSRIIYILRKINDSEGYADFRRTATYSYFNPLPLIEQFRQGYTSVIGAACLTHEGEEFLESIRSFAETYAFSEQPLQNRD